ncbi:MAG: endonuclease domain-containing protein [Lysobacter sp.]|nr:endonuclease domain-containing protein [Lysobacter sp.]
MREGQKRNFARILRANMTDAEAELWKHLRRRQLLGCKFRRQHPIGPYVVDFACLERRLVVEVDGGQHAESASDPRRDACIGRLQFVVVRFWNDDVLTNIDGVCGIICEHLAAASPHPGLPPQAEEGEKRPPQAGEGDQS